LDIEREGHHDVMSLPLEPGDSARPADRPSAEQAPPPEDASPPEDAPVPTGARPGGSRDAKAKTVPRTRTGAIWVAVVATVVLGVFLVIFIAQNNQDVEVSFLGFEGSMPLAVALLSAAVAGAGLVVLAGTARIVQLRLVARRNRAMPPSG